LQATPVGFSPSGEWSDDDYGVLADEIVLGRIFKANAAPVGLPMDGGRWRSGRRAAGVRLFQ
jgi:hypothetical protein